MHNWKIWPPLALGLLTLAFVPLAPGQQDKKQPDRKEPDKGRPFGGPGGFGGAMGQTRKVAAQFDKNKDGWLNAEERKAAREFLKKSGGGRGGKGKGGFGFGRGKQDPPKAGPKVKSNDVKAYTKQKLYDPTVLRTFFLEFENKDWEQELADFFRTDIEVPATLTVDGKKYPRVGVRFRGMSSYMGVGEGYKRSFNISMDLVDKKQRLYGHKTLNLLNSHGDPSFLHTVLYSEIANKSIPTPKANLVKVAINGESWGIYTSAQQFNSEFTAEVFGSKKGDRWKVQGSPGGRGGLEYTGDNIEDYKRRFRIKSKDDEKAWKALIELCKVLNKTPADKLEAALKPILDIDGALWFLALDVALINNDGYWVRASDYSLYRDPKGKFHLIPHDMNETFSPAMSFGGGPRGPGGPGGRGGRFGPGAPLAKPALEAADKDSDGKLTKAEVTTALKALFKAARPDKNGNVSEDALTKTLDKILPKPPAFGNFTPPSPAPGLAKGIIEKAGKDGKLTEARLLEEAGKLLTKVDGNKDGKLDEQEIAEALREILPAPRFGRPGGPGGPGRGPGGPGGFGGPRGGGVELDPLVGLTDVSKPLRSRLLAVPALKERYLKYVRTIAEERLDWKNLGPSVARYRTLIEKEIEADTRKLSGFDAFKRATADADASKSGGREMSLRAFADQRRKYLLAHPEIKKLAK